MWRTIFKAKWSAVVIGCFRSEFYIAVHYHGNGSIVSSFFFLASGKFSGQYASLAGFILSTTLNSVTRYNQSSFYPCCEKCVKLRC